MRNTRWKGSKYIPQEILLEILVRLPVKSLVRFMCVLKLWSNIIQSSSFIATHLRRNDANHANTLFIAQCCSKGKRNIYSLRSNETFEECFKIGNPLGIKESFTIYGSSNGLVCLSDEIMKLNSPICIYNPSIRKHVVLPRTDILCKPPVHPYFSNLAFGFHRELNDYKVVRVVFFVGRNNPMKAEIYSLSTNSWKKIGINHFLVKTRCWKYDAIFSAFIDGVAYWINTLDGADCLASFDTSSEVFDEFLVRRAIVGGKIEYSKYKNSICLLHYNIKLREDHVDMWVFEEKSFKKLHTIVIPEPRLTPLGFTMNNELLVVHNSWSLDQKKNSRSRILTLKVCLVLCNLESEKVIETGITLARNFCGADTYVESLILLNDWKGTI